jgi:membrane protein
VIRRALRLAWRAFLRYQDHNGPDRAAAVAYYTLMSLLPMLIFLISIGVAFMGSFEQAYRGTLFLISGVVVHLDERSLDALRTFVERSLKFRVPALFLLAWTSRRIFGSLFSALERIFGVPGRSFAGGSLAALAAVLTAGVGLMVTMVATMTIATAEGLLTRLAGPEPAGALHALVGVVVTKLVPIAIAFSFFFLVYRTVPRKVVSTAHAAEGALLATILWELAKNGFAYYLRNLTRVAGLYGTLEGVIVLAIWLELSVSIVLYCAEIVALLIGAPRSRRAPAAPAPALAAPAESTPVQSFTAIPGKAK